jgi:hypothetical protein
MSGKHDILFLLVIPTFAFYHFSYKYLYNQNKQINKQINKINLRL